jgi:glycosyltransferase involved in cell wall biosynthesis
MNLLRVIGTLNPAYGGPVEVFHQINSGLFKLGHRVEAVTLDQPDAPWIADISGIVHALGPSLGKYRYNERLIPWLKAKSGNYDAVLVDGIWQFQSFGTWIALRRILLPYFVFVHGALDPWFKRTFPIKHLKKWLYWRWAEYRVLRDARAVLFTCEEERILARQSFRLYRADEAVVDMGISDPSVGLNGQRDLFLKCYPAVCGKRLLLFLGRIHQNKGCDLLIEAFAKVAEKDPALHLVMAGPDQEGWQRKLMTMAKTHGVDNRITWTGMLTRDIKWGAFHAAETFILPSHSENFGIVVAEALACGLPVLITDKVNIWREIVRDGAGFAEPDTIDGTVALLEKWLGLSEVDIHRMRKNARACFESHFEIQRAARNLVDVIEQRLHVMSKNTKPFRSISEKR